MADAVVRDADSTADADGTWAVLEPVLRRGDTYAIEPAISREDALDWWSGHQRVRVAVAGGSIVGTSYIGPNQAGNGAHVANAGYVVAPDARGLGIGRLLGLDSLEVARAEGFTAMQFNLVVATNTAAVGLWSDLGFDVVGTVPGAFDHPEVGLVDAHVMHRLL